MSYVYYGDTPALIKNVDATNGALQAIAPSYTELAENGTLRISESMDPAFVDAMHSRNMKVIPYLGNEWNRDIAEKALQNRNTLSTQITAAIKKYNWDGINVDLENISSSSKTALVDFVKLLRTKLPADKEVSIAVPANPDGLEDAYNLKALAAACDYIMLMAYDEHYPGDPKAGPVAGLPFVESSIQYALTQIPSSQLVLGIPFYGRLWNGQTSYDGAGVTNELASRLAAKYGGTEYYDKKEQSVHSEFTIKATDPRTKVFGQSLPNGKYTLWYENERSLKAKLELVQKYKLKGTGSWSLNQATSDTWSYYDSWSNGYYYIDLQNHWSQQEATEMINKGWMIGVSPTLFAPELPLTRAQAATIMARALADSNKMVKVPINPASTGYSDVLENYWAYSDILSMTNLGVVSGIGNQLFAPDSPITREEISSLISRLLNLQPKSRSVIPFSDVSTSRWSFSAIAALAENQILLGYEDGSFHPEEQISRAQMAVILSRIQDQLK
ncbi:glycosyl hydrolase family 18 protein [Paenibacillus psychroresistens]|nr:glycosyl hydrolase family 18 protein [Paenibacillus psychroresistens]